MRIGILTLQGNVIEHRRTLTLAAKHLEIEIETVLVRKTTDFDGLEAIVLPGGESTTISLLLEKFGMLEKLRRVPAIMGTCAGLILMAKDVEGLGIGQKTLEIMDVKVSRNAYGSQMDSFSSDLNWLEGGHVELKKIMFIRAPKIISVGQGVRVLAKIKDSDEIAIVEQEKNGQYLLGMACHPEMTTSMMAEYFLRKITT